MATKEDIGSIEGKDVGSAGEVDNGKMREGTRSNIARNYVTGYFFCIFLVLIIGLQQGWTVDDNKDMLLALSGTLSGPLGFIIGYYFKSQNE